MKRPESVLITGATSAIGSALASIYAAPGVTLHLHGRNHTRLTEVATMCQAKGAMVQSFVADVRDTAAMRTWLLALGPLDLVIINAGMNTHIGPAGEPEPWAAVEAVVAVNLTAAMAVVDALLPAMRQRRRGQIAVMSSLAGYFGLPVTPAYSASKAGLKAYGEALRGWLAPEGIRVNVIMPGFVASPMSAAMPGSKPWQWTPERTARTIQRRLKRNQARISFPFPLNWGTWWLAALPAAWSQRLVCWFGFGPPRG